MWCLVCVCGGERGLGICVCVCACCETLISAVVRDYKPTHADFTMRNNHGIGPDAKAYPQ